MRLSRTILLTTAAIAIFSSCTRRSSVEKSSTEPKWLRWWSGTARVCPSAILDDHPALSAYSCLTHEGLARLEWKSGKLTALPSIAASIEQAGPTVWRVRLRNDARWSDGAELTAAEVADSWKRSLAACAIYPLAVQVWHRVREARAFCEGRAPFSQVGVRVEDAHTLRVETIGPFPGFPASLAHPAFWPSRGEIGIGPFRLVGGWEGPEARFARNPFHAGEPAALDGMRVERSEAGIMHRVQRFLSSEVDVVDGLPPSALGTLAGDDRLRPFPMPRLGFLVLSPAVGTREVRGRLAAAWNPEEPIALWHWPHRASRSLGAFDPALPVLNRWAALNVPWPSSPTEEPPPLPVLSTPSEWEEVAANLRAQWIKHLGWPTAPAGTPVNAWIVERPSDVLHPEADYRYWLEAFGDKWGRARLRPFESALSSALSATTAVERSEALDRAERFLVEEEVWVVPLLSLGESALVSKRVSRLAKDPFGFWEWRTVGLD